ncbi:hypothetical protein NQ317_001797 [Molorchus minor]|uniref:Uncharacterized protein n=1 Tax=Molorchus minor TaxID=1323400 RepID=A0ABQ9IUI5_9CUCU|nr:hypothetical protein NQ317_001797 [Molorchus minor]
MCPIIFPSRSKRDTYIEFVPFVVLLFLALVATTQARPQFSQLKNAAASILRFTNDLDPTGAFEYHVEQSDGTRQDAKGAIKNAGTDDEALVVQGSYSYVGDDGKTYEVKYTADEEGYHPAGEHLPPSAGVNKLGIPSAAVASLAGGGLG